MIPARVSQLDTADFRARCDERQHHCEHRAAGSVLRCLFCAEQVGAGLQGECANLRMTLDVAHGEIERLAALAGDAARLQAAAKAFLLAFDEVHPVETEAHVLEQLRSGIPYRGPTYGHELRALRALLQEPPA